MLLASTGSEVLSQLDRFKESFLWAAAKGGRVEECEMLLQMGTDVNWVSAEGDTPLLAACRNGHTATALCLLDHGADVNAAAAADGLTALHLSCRKGIETIAEALIEKGADSSAVNEEGSTPFEGLGLHVPTGMLRRLKTVAQRRIQNYRTLEAHPNSATTTLLPDEQTSGGAPQSLGTVRGRPSSKEFRQRCRQQANRTASGGGADGGAGVAGAQMGIDSTRGVGNGRERQHSERRTRGGQGDESGGRERLTEATRRERAGSVADSDGRREADTHIVGNRTTFPAIASGAAHPSPLRGSPAEPSSSRGEKRGDGVIQRARSDGGSDHNHTRAVRDSEGAGPLLGSEESASSSESCVSSDDDEEEIFARARCPASSPNRADNLQDSQGDEHRTEFWPLLEGASRPTLTRLLARNVPTSQAAAAVAAAIGSASPSATTRDDNDLDLQSAQQHQHHQRDQLESPFDPTSAWQGTAPSSAVNDEIQSVIRGADSGRSRGFYFGSAAMASEAQTSTPIGQQVGAVDPSSTSGFGQYSALIPGGSGAAPTAGREERGQREWSRIMEASMAGDVTSYDESFGRSPSERGRRDGRSGESIEFGLPAAERDAANDHVSLIRTLWLQEKETRLAAEAKAEAVRDQSARLWNELVRSEKQVLSLEEASACVREERDKLNATLTGENIKGRSLQELEQLEKELRKTLEGVCNERDRIVQDQLAKEEQRLCVVCQEKERGVLLLPCRHLCVCRGCSERQELTLCPLCRDNIAERLVVYS